MNETDRLRRVAQVEIDNHLAEADRLKGIAHDLLASSEWHLGQSNQWLEYIGGLGVEQEAVVLPFVPEQRRHLRVIEGEQV